MTMTTMLPVRASVACLFYLLLCIIAMPAFAKSFYAFESGQVRPVAMSAGGQFLYVTNTPDNRLEIFRISEAALIPIASVPVGMEPVAVAAGSNGTIWVVNKLSDSVSVVRKDANGFRVFRTLPVGDEPQDIVFGGPNRNLVFVSAARRDLERPKQPLIGNADVWVFDADAVDQPETPEPLKVINMFTDVPRALAVSNDGNSVFVASHFSGNRTTVISDDVVAGDIPPPLDNADGIPAPGTALIVRNENGQWLDAADRDWSDKVNFTLTDFDIFRIDASAAVPALVERLEGVGTTLFNMAVNPVTGEVYVSNLEVRNHVRFEGPGVHGGTTLNGNIASSRITVISQGQAKPRDLNKHIDFTRPLGTLQEKAASLAFPLEMAVSSDGKKLYVAALGSGKIGVFDTTELRNDSFVPDPANHIELTGGGPTGVVLDETRDQLYALTRFDNSVSVIDLITNQEVSRAAMYNPEPASLVAGRRFLYDARLSSSRGNAACASCHIFGDKDELAWNLGNPDGQVEDNPNIFVVDPLPFDDISFHPMKGPMTTQSLRGMANHGPMHWRGDKTGGNDPGSGDPMDEVAAFKLFNSAFPNLLGRESELPDAAMQAFADFALQLTYPPNPLRNKDNSLTESQTLGREFYFTFPTFFGSSCNDCHVLSVVDGFFGSDGRSVNVRGPQVMKVPHLRNAYTKAGIGRTNGELSTTRFKAFSYGHAGSTPTIKDLLANQDAGRFDFPGGPAQRRDVSNWVMVIDSELAPVVGQQVTVTAVNSPQVLDSLSNMVVRSQIIQPRPECDLIAKGVLAGEARGWVMNSNGQFTGDRASETPYSIAQLFQIARTAGQEVTFTCVPPGAGIRMGIDRDEDGIYDRDELAAASSSKTRR